MKINVRKILAIIQLVSPTACQYITWNNNNTKVELNFENDKVIGNMDDSTNVLAEDEALDYDIATRLMLESIHGAKLVVIKIKNTTVSVRQFKTKTRYIVNISPGSGEPYQTFLNSDEIIQLLISIANKVISLGKFMR